MVAQIYYFCATDFYVMEKIGIINRTNKKEGTVRIRFRLVDGRDVYMYHRSNIKADLQDLQKIDESGNFIPGIRKRSISLLDLQMSITEEIALMRQAYAKMKQNGIEMRSDLFEEAIQLERNPESGVRTEDNTLLARLDKFVEDSYSQGMWGENRYSLYKLVYKEVERFLTIKGKLAFTPSDFTPNDVLEYRQFIIDEYKYVKKWAALYVDESERNIPKEPRSSNTAATRVKQLKAFFSSLEDADEIAKSPFRKLGKERVKLATKERYDEPVYLYFEEFEAVMKKEVPDNLRETKDAFLLQCAFGCRVADFQKMTMENVGVDKNGIPYIHYLPNKTMNEQRDNAEIETPILRYALDIIKRYRFQFTILHYVSGEWGYNAKIKQLLKHCGIDRKCNVFNEEKRDNEYIPLHELASSKLCRKTHVDIMNKAQVNMYAAGLHRIGSDAVNRYTKLELADKFKLMCYAFGQEEYRVDGNLNVIKTKKNVIKTKKPPQS